MNNFLKNIIFSEKKQIAEGLSCLFFHINTLSSSQFPLSLPKIAIGIFIRFMLSLNINLGKILKFFHPRI